MIKIIATLVVWAVWVVGFANHSPMQSFGLALANAMGGISLMVLSRHMPKACSWHILGMGVALVVLGCGDVLFGFTSQCINDCTAAAGIRELCYTVGTIGFLLAGILIPHSLEKSNLLPAHSSMSILGISGILAAVASFGGIAVSGRVDPKTLLYSFSAFFLAAIFVQVARYGYAKQKSSLTSTPAEQAVRLLGVAFVVAGIAQIVRILAVDNNGVAFLPWAYDMVWIGAMCILVISLSKIRFTQHAI